MRMAVHVVRMFE